EENEEYDDDEDKTKNTDDSEGDKDEEMDYTTIRTDEGFVQEDGNDAKTEVPVTSSSHSSDLATKFLNFLDIPHTNSEIVSPFDVHVHHETNAKLGSVDGGFVATVVGGGVGVDCGGGGVKDVIDVERKFMNLSLVAPSLVSRCSSIKAVT
nr:hypothetical protein [Tanacetum cinerariifolium]